MTGSADQLARLQEEFEAQILTRDDGLLDDFPQARYIAFFDALPTFSGYRSVPREARDFCAAIEQRAGLEGLEAYHRLILIRLVAERERRLQGRAVTASIRALITDYHDRVVRDMEAPRKRFYVHDNDRFAKDFAVCRLKLLPCGVELVDQQSGIGRSVLAKGAIGQMLSGLCFFLFRIGGFKPLYEIHFDQRLVNEFNEDGYTRLYLRLADLIEQNPHIKGVSSSSWWHDPHLAHISPELGFIGKIPEGAGARLFVVGESDDATSDATKFSPHRLKLYRDGRYRPRVYLMVWSRTDLLAWASRYRSESETTRIPAVIQRTTPDTVGGG